MALRQDPVSRSEPETDHASVKRSMSRYRRTRVATAPANVPMTPAVPQNIVSNKASANSQLRTRYRKDSIPDLQQKRPATARRNTDLAEPVESGHVDQYFPPQGQLHTKNSFINTPDSHEAPELFPPTRFTEADAARILSEQKRKDLERLDEELTMAQSTQRTSPGKISTFFSRKRGVSKPSPNTSGDDTALLERARSDERPEPRKMRRANTGIEPGGGGVVPQTDAPMSAVNAGERRVLVRCKQSSIALPVTPETTSKDLIYTALNVMGQKIDPATAIISESYTQLGLERRLRRYEHIREIMNSWDRDTQNALHISASDSSKGDVELEAAYAPVEKPSDVSMLMYHSQKPGKWNKRFVTLLSSGQIFISKKRHAKATDKDVQSICHLSDFDIYTPTAAQTRKVLRPPKKFCYAVKSQQKTTVFLSTENFVHFFCTEDFHVAEDWSASVQKWRSWYLVQKMGSVKKTSGTEASGDPYNIGSFAPLIDLTKQSSPQHRPQDSSDDENTPRQIPFHLRHGQSRAPRGYPPSAYPKVALPSSGDMPIAEIPTDDTAFSPTGLLGRTYSQRQKALQKEGIREKSSAATLSHDRELRRSSIEVRDRDRDGPTSPSHFRTMSLRRPSISAPPASTSLTRNASTKRPDFKPLVDLTPSFKEAPQWSKEGKGRGVAAPSGVPLVEAAHSTWDAVALAEGMAPVTRTFRREESRTRDGGRDRDKERAMSRTRDGREGREGRDRDRAQSRPRTAGRRDESRVRGRRD